MEHGVAHGDEDAENHDESSGQRESPAGAFDDGLDRESHGERQTGDRALVQQAPGERLELAGELTPAEPEEKTWA
ncbi:hypothetical protein GCM10010518_05240 [Kitasatospora cinereorecta]